MNKIVRGLVPVVVIAAAIGGFGTMLANKAVPPKVEAHKHVHSVRVAVMQRSDVPVTLHSQGMVEAERTTQLAAEVAGRVTEVSPKWKVGELFEQGETLVGIDSADYEAALKQAEAALADARLAEASEKARAEQAVRDWAKLAANEKPTELAVRKPHLESTAARVKAAEAAVVKAKRDVERTSIKAPFRGRLRSKRTELGSVLSPGAPIAELYSVDRYEVRLPLSLDDFAFLNESKTGGSVTLSATLAGNKHTWTAKVVRVEGEVERSSRSAYVVVEVEDKEAAAGVLKPGLFLKAEVQGRKLEKVLRVPRKAFLDERRVLVVDGENKVRFREVAVVRSDGSDQLVRDGLKEGERVVVTALGAPVEGMDVEIVSEEKNAPGGQAP